MMAKIKKIGQSIIKLFKTIIRERILVWFVIWYFIFSSPIIVGYSLFVITRNKYHLIYASAVLGFWAGPFTPLIPLTIACAFATKKFLNRRKKKFIEKYRLF